MQDYSRFAPTFCPEFAHKGRSMQDCGFRPEWRLAFIARVVRLLQVATPATTSEPRGRAARRSATQPIRQGSSRPGRY
jgi:hypothetical protein